MNGQDHSFDYSTLRRNSATLAACITAGILVLGLIALKAYEVRYHPRFIDVNPHATPFWGPSEVNAFFFPIWGGYYDSKGQRLALRVALLVLAPIVLLIPSLRGYTPIFGRPRWRRIAWGTTIFVGLAAYLFCLRRSGLPGGEALLVGLDGISKALAFALVAGYVRRGRLNRLIGVLVWALVAAVDLPGLVTRLDLSRSPLHELLMVEHHYANVLGQPDRLAAGHRFLDMVKPMYSFLVYLILAGYQRHVRPLTMGGVVVAVQGMEFLYLILCIVIIYRQSRGRWLLCIIASLLVIPWCHFYPISMRYPNLSAWRTLGIPLALFAIPLAYRRPLVLSSFALGCLAGGLILLNVESGLVATAGLLAVLFFRTDILVPRDTRRDEGPDGSAHFPGPDRGDWAEPSDRRRRVGDLLSIAPFFVGLVVAGLLFSATWRLLMGYWPSPQIVSYTIERIAFFSGSDWGGARYPGQIMPLALFSWSAFLLIYIALTACGRSSPAHGVRIGAATISLAWLAYYVKGPGLLNQASYAILFAIPAIDGLRRLTAAVRVRRPGNLASLSALALTAFVTIPSIGEFIDFNFNPRITARYFSLQDSFKALAPRLARKPHTRELSGIVVSEEAADEIEAKARGLARLSHGRPVIYLTPHCYLIPKVSGIYSELPVGDPFGESLAKGDYHRLLDYIRASGASEIYVDPPGQGPPEDYNAVVNFYNMLLLDLRDAYQFDRFADGWQIWVRIGGGRD
jgi:hypothetical protein